MTTWGILQIILYLSIILILVKPLGWYMARVYENKPCGLNQLFRPIEYFIYRLSSVDPKQEMGWKRYLTAMLILNFLGILATYLIQRLQLYLPFNPQAFPNLPAYLSFNTAVSYGTNTDWQAYISEASVSYFTQMSALTVQNFLSAATGIALLIALIRGITKRESNNLGNFWVDLVRGILYILLPLSCLLAIFLSSQGVIQNFKPYQHVSLLEPIVYTESVKNTQNLTHTQTIISTEQVLPMGPVASQVAIKQLGSNGGGFFHANAAHPFENPTPLSNFIEMLAILLIPSALCYTFGYMVRDKRQGWTIFFTMMILFIPMICLSTASEQQGNPLFTSLGIDQAPIYNMNPGGNMEGKELRFGITPSALWTAATTATSNGSTNSSLDSFIPLGSITPIWLMHLGEIVFGGVGSGLYAMLMLVIITVFVSGLMVGRTPEYLGKKIEPYEMKMAAVAVLIMPLIVLLFTAISVVIPVGIKSISNSGPHGFSQILYAFTSMGNNNGSAFAGLDVTTPFYNIMGGVEMLLLRFWIAIAVLAIAGALARKQVVPHSLGTLPTHTPLFIILLICIITILGALTFFPALALGPIVEQLMLWGYHGY